jgi:hypothetical protein
MRVLIGCESSGTVRRAFRALGHDAWSCDLLPADDGDPHHFQRDVLEVIEHEGPWDLGIFHPPCTYLTCSAEWAYSDGPYHMKLKLGTLTGAARRAARIEALEFVRRLLSCGIPRIALENPVGVIGTQIAPASQCIQPWQFGHDASKATCLWLHNLPPLRNGEIVAGRVVGMDKRGNPVQRWANQTDSGQNRLSPADDRWKLRSATYAGIAQAMAEQWGREQAERTPLQADIFDSAASA